MEPGPLPADHTPVTGMRDPSLAATISHSPPGLRPGSNKKRRAETERQKNMFNHPPRNLQEALQTAFLRPQTTGSSSTAPTAGADAHTGSRPEPSTGHTGRHDEKTARRQSDSSPSGAAGAH